jgi:hypothetical protein
MIKKTVVIENKKFKNPLLKKCTEKVAGGVVLNYPYKECILKCVGVRTSSSRSL